MKFFGKFVQYGLEYFGLYYGSYHGKVIEIVPDEDDKSPGRIRATCQALWPNEPDPPYLLLPKYGPAGAGHGLWHLPVVGDGVWIECKHGQTRNAEYVGGWWGAGEIPAGMGPDGRGQVTPAGWRVFFDDAGDTGRLASPNDDQVVLLNHATGEITITNGIANEIRLNSDGKFEIEGADKLVAILSETLDALAALTIASGGGPPLNLATFIALQVRAATIKE